MGQIPRPIERISSYTDFCSATVVTFFDGNKYKSQ